MKRPRPIRLEPTARPLNDLDLERVTGGEGIFKLKQHVDNPGQTPMKP
ncbi:MAG TPA: hypothetical protein VHT91_21680 [Kofleriaceae bacterium]|jgi:hypothetical protein|nr:hypothetical protein [Kofleriaceae bacterium]